ncbi:MAG: hypothetical protein IJU50_02640 [Lachnospiraceae bacterium]|nr:hypothetical protein [Lachnospiraceae bacterium]
MASQEFIDKLVHGITAHEEWGFTREDIRVFKEGCRPEDEEGRKLVQETNMRYFQKDSDIMASDFMVLGMWINNIRHFIRASVDDLEDMWEKKGEESVWRLISDRITAQKMVSGTSILQSLENYEVVREQLIIRPINYTDHRYDLKEAVYRQIGDVCLVVYILLMDDPDKVNGIMSTKLNRSTLEKWGMTQDAVYEEALTNTYLKYPPRLYDPLEARPNMPYAKGAFMAINRDFPTITPLMVPLLTTTRMRNGAVAPFYPGVPQRISELMEGNSFYIVFTGEDEAMLHRKGAFSPRTLLDNLKENNAAFPGDILSRKVFYYDKDKQEIQVLGM